MQTLTYTQPVWGEFHVAYLIGLVGKRGFCGEVYSAVHGEKCPGIQSWPSRVGGAGEVLQCDLRVLWAGKPLV